MRATQKHLPTMVAVAALAVALSAGCEKTTTITTVPGTTTSTTTIKPAPKVERALEKAGDAMADAAITAKVKTTLLADAEVKGMQIDVDTRNGIVTLTGAVDDARNVERAATLARGIEGVKSVENRLTAKAPG